MIFAYYIAFNETGEHGEPRVYIIKGDLVPNRPDDPYFKGYFKVEKRLSFLGPNGCISLSKIAQTNEELGEKISNYFLEEIEDYEKKIKYIKEKMVKPIEFVDL